MADDNVTGTIWRVYRITCIPNGRFYIGITNGPVSTRWSNHVSAALRGETSAAALGRSIRKYGREQFVIDELYQATSREEAMAVERGLIACYGTLRPSGMNSTSGGEGSPNSRRPHSQETRLKISKAHKGKKVSEETRKRMGAWRIGRPMPEETCKKISQTMATRAPSPHAIAMGRLATIERARRWREAHPKVRIKQTSGIKGVCWDSGKNRWLVTIWADKKTRHIGRFSDIEAAKAALIVAQHQYALSLKNPTSQP